MKWIDKFVKPKARLKIGHRYSGSKGTYIAQGYVIFKEWDKEDGRYYHWEEWELTGFDNYDSWVEYDHYSHELTVYEPFRATEQYEVMKLGKGSIVTLTTKNGTFNGVVDEAGTGTVVKLKGKMSYQLFDDDIIHYAELKTGPDTVVSIEDYRQTGDTDYDYYSGRRLTRKEQKVMFGKVLSPFPVGPRFMLYMLAIGGFMIWSLIPQYQTVCTPRTATTNSSSLRTSQIQPNNTTPNSIANSQQNECKRVRMYSGGGGGGVGK